MKYQDFYHFFTYVHVKCYIVTFYGKTFVFYMNGFIARTDLDGEFDWGGITVKL